MLKEFRKMSTNILKPFFGTVTNELKKLIFFPLNPNLGGGWKDYHVKLHFPSLR